MDIAKLLGAKEGENIEFKEAKPRFGFGEPVNFTPRIWPYGGVFK